MNRVLIYTTIIVFLFSTVTSSFDLNQIESRKLREFFSVQDGFPKERIVTAYNSLLTYRDYLHRTVDKVNREELLQNNGTRLPILCSSDDYFYYLTHYLPAPIKAYLLPSYHTQVYTSEERHALFYHTIKTLPPHVRGKAVAAKADLETFVAVIPASGITSLVEQHIHSWNNLVDKMLSHVANVSAHVASQLEDHRRALDNFIITVDTPRAVTAKLPVYRSDKDIGQNDEDSWDQYNHTLVEHDTFTILADDQQQASEMITQLRATIQRWQQETASHFLNTVTTMGPLRVLAENMFEDAMAKTLHVANNVTAKNYDDLTHWHSVCSSTIRQVKITLSVLPSVTTADDLDKQAAVLNNRLYHCGVPLRKMKLPDSSRDQVKHAIDRIWNKASTELIYSRWQWNYWRDLWNEGGISTILRSFSTFIH